MARVETIKFNDFMSGAYKEPKVKMKHTAASSLAAAGTFLYAKDAVIRPLPVSAQEAVPVFSDQILPVFDPLIDFIISLAYPVAGVMLSVAALMIMINQKEKGYSMIFNAAIGYVAVQMMPMFLKILVQVGKASLGA